MIDGKTPVAGSKASVHLTTAACLLGLVGIFFSLVHFIRPTALTFALFMLAGQGSFGLALFLYVIAVVKDLKRQKVL